MRARSKAMTESLRTTGPNPPCSAVIPGRSAAVRISPCRRPAALAEIAAVDDTYVIPYDTPMKTITASEARASLYKLIDETAVTSEPVQITGKRANAVLVSIDDWRAIEETLHLVSIPGMRASIRKGLKTPIAECLDSLDW